MNIKRLFIISGSILLGLTIILIWSLFEPPILTRAASYTVCTAGPPTCDYSSVQSAVDAAGNGDVIKVATGKYTGINNRGGLAQVVYLDKSITIRGGYTTSNWTTSDPTANITTLDAEGQGRVLYITGNISPTIEGLHITGGDADGLDSPFSIDAGAGVFIHNATAVIRDNQIFANTANSSHEGGGDGGGICLYQSDATLEGNTISDNYAKTVGGGVLLSESKATLKGNTISSNISGESGGGLFLSSSPATLSGNTISDNTAAYAGQGGGGGGIMIDLSAATLHNNTINSNSADGGGGLMISESDNTALYGNTVSYNESESGGGIDCRGSDGVIINGNTISYNSGDWAGGVDIKEDCSVLFMGNMISHNTAINFGGGVVWGGSGSLTNNIIVDNHADNGSGLHILSGSPLTLHNTIARNHGPNGIFIYSGSVVLKNNIIAKHTVGIFMHGDSSASLNATLWGTGTWANDTDWAGDGTINTSNDVLGDPDFVDPDNDDYHIGPDSDAIDQGVDAGVTNDIDHHPRPYQEPDIGADEYWPPGTLKFIYLPVITR